MSRGSIILKAHELINEDRENQHGKPETTFADIATYWSTYLRNRFKDKDTPIYLNRHDVCMMMILLKVARGPENEDNWIDIAGYAGLGADFAEVALPNSFYRMKADG